MSGALLLVTVWAFWDDEFARRGFKTYQEEYHKTQYQRARVEWKETNDKIAAKEIEIQTQLAGEAQRLESSEAYQALSEAALEAQIHLDEEKEQKKFAGSRVDEAYYYFKKAMHEGRNYDVEKAKLEELEEKVREYDPLIAEKQEILDKAEAALMEFKAKSVNLEKELRSLVSSRAIIEQKMDYYRPFNLMWRPAEILQTVIPGFSINNFSEIVYRVDRCMTCHVSYKDPYYEEFKEPLKTHPNLEILIKKHPPERTGCTWCHLGQGTATAPVEDAHGSHHEMDQTREVNEPILLGDQMQSNCRNCHDGVMQLEGAPMLNKGKKIFQKLGCHGCHLAEGFEKEPKVGPSLRRIKWKVGAAWIYDWVKNPKNYLPETRMPDFELNDKDALAITAYLVESSDKDFKYNNDLPPGDAANGKKLFESVGCQACHQFKGEGEKHAPDLTNVGTKVRPRWLVNWISSPHSYNPGSEMPDLRLSESEGADIAAYLLDGKDRIRDRELEKRARNPELVAYGEKLVRGRGCFACHDVNGMDSEGRIAPELSSFGRKMVAELEFGDTHIPHTWDNWVRTKLKEPTSFRTERVLDKMPNFHLSDDEINALVVLLRGFNGSKVPDKYQDIMTAREQALETGRRLIDRYNCKGCHHVEGEGGYIQKYLKGTVQYPPPLEHGDYHVGERIKPSWIFSFLKNPTPVRTWVDVKMPTFSFSDKEIQELTAYFEALSPEKIKYEEGLNIAKPVEKVQTGVKVVNYMDCGKCHDDGAKGISFKIASSRLKQEWIPKWMKETQSLIPWTKMPNHWDEEEGKLVVKTKFRELKTIGSVDQQVNAITDFIVGYNNPDYDNSLVLGEVEEVDEDEEEDDDFFEGGGSDGASEDDDEDDEEEEDE
ncbi:MAG: c-type cytochrome [Candidatus Nitrohelix vancouverensis]|uniref:C-type cytochrome n=1 Tax=Candidatus Nitrohelix vancouverensis TaxID=2705534 RepID=A0A7T0C5A2_9BACT|nr:MAG: c-type cytochrome [Candidatus Nitrohelix vancouverensis]